MLSILRYLNKSLIAAKWYDSSTWLWSVRCSQQSAKSTDISEIKILKIFMCLAHYRCADSIQMLSKEVKRERVKKSIKKSIEDPSTLPQF